MEQANEIQALLAEGLNALRLPDEAAETLAQYEALLLRKNQVMNLTSITDPVKAAQLHILDSAALLSQLDFRGRRVIDVGTGAGLPGLVLKLIDPSIELTLLDSLGKRITWLSEIVGPLGVPEVECVHGRAEEYGTKKEYREQFEIVTSRAVADLRILSELCLPLVAQNGYFVAMKSTASGAETAAAARAIETLGGAEPVTIDYTIPGTAVSHRLIVIRKSAPTPAEYPRRYAKIQKNPL